MPHCAEIALRFSQQPGKHQKEIEIQEAALSDTDKSHTHVDITETSPDVREEHRRVQNIPAQGDREHSIVIRGLRKVFPGFGGSPSKVRKGSTVLQAQSH